MLNSSPWLFNSPAFYNEVATTSVRIDKPSTAYLSKSVSTGDSRTQSTYAWWMKRASDSTAAGTSLPAEIFCLGGSGGGASQSSARITLEADKINVSQEDNNAVTWEVITTQLFRDFSAWYHCVVVIDTTQSTAADRVKIYINGNKVTSFSTASYPSQNYISRFGLSGTNRIGVGEASGNPWSASYFNGYFADMYLLDGIAVSDSSSVISEFGEFKNGVWIAKEYTGSYGTNGFHFKFDQSGVGTASSSTIGADTSGNTNHYTSSGIVASDCAMPDSPENNWCTLNPNARGTTNVSLSEGNLKFVKSGANFGNVLSTMPLFSGKWYFEGVCLNNDLAQIGVQEITNNIYQNSGDFGANTDLGMWDSRGFFYDEGTAGGTPPSYTTGDIIGIAFDVEAGKIWFAKNGTYLFSGDPANGTNQSTGSTNNLSSIGVTPAGNGENGGGHTFNFGQDSSFVGAKTAQGNTDDNGIGDFYYSPPSGFLALCSANLPETTISPNAGTQADDYFNTVLYTGIYAPISITGVGFQPDWVWIKERNSSTEHILTDSLRGAGKFLVSQTTTAERTSSSQITSFDSDGFSMSSGDSGTVNGSGDTYVSWNWKANGSPVINTAGTITSQVSANTNAGFSIVSYTGTGGTATVGHGLGVAPNVIIVKNRIDGSDWFVYHSANTSAPETEVLQLNLTDATVDFNPAWSDALPTSSVFTVGTSNASNGSSDTMIAYCFAEIESYSKFGSYIGNGSTDGTFVYTGFRPAFVICKKTSGANSWTIQDNARNINNPVSNYLLADDSGAEGTSGLNFDFVSNGFKLRTTSGAVNASGASHIYMAFAESPFKYSTAR
jgi:hypothetical protein